MIFPGHAARKAFPKISKYFNAGEWNEIHRLLIRKSPKSPSNLHVKRASNRVVVRISIQFGPPISLSFSVRLSSPFPFIANHGKCTFHSQSLDILCAKDITIIELLKCLMIISNKWKTNTENKRPKQKMLDNRHWIDIHSNLEKLVLY